MLHNFLIVLQQVVVLFLLILIGYFCGKRRIFYVIDLRPRALYLFDTFLDIFNEMDGEAFQLKIYRLPSRNFKGKDFLTCSLI